MRKNHFIAKVLIFLGAIFCVSGYFGAVNAFAEDKPTHHLGIAPTQSNLGTIKPGENYSGSFEVVNEGYGTSEFEIDFAPYSIKNEKYEPVFDATSSYTEIVKWITTSITEGALEPNQKQVVNFTVNVPENAHGGSQSAVIVVRLKTNDESDKTAVNTVQQLGYLVFGNVDGDVIKTGKILENKLPQFLFNPPIYGSALVENTGNVYTVATHTLQVFPLFSDEEIFTNEEKPETSIVFPETKRLFNSEWEGAPQLGIFRVRHTVKIFDEESVVEKVVFLCPIWFLFIVILMVILIIFWIVSRIFKRKQEA